MDSQRKISGAVIRRLPGYYRYLKRLEMEGVQRISSQDLGQQMGLTASQIRQDMNCFGGFGQQGYGYNIHELRLKISEILGLDRSYTMAIVGAGKIGQAILSYDGFRSMDFHITAMFDTDPELIGRRVRDITIYDAANIREVLTASPVDVGRGRGARGIGAVGMRYADRLWRARDMELRADRLKRRAGRGDKQRPPER